MESLLDIMKREDPIKLTLLQGMLSLAVPLWVERLRGRTWAEIAERAQVCAQIVAEKGDIILYRSKKPGESAKAFNALAEGIACLSFSPGGVKLLGLSFESVLAGDHGLKAVAPEHVETLTKVRVRKPRRVE